jgi:hypothetical protein
MRKVLITALLAASGVAAPVASAGSSTTTATLVLVRTTSGASSFDLTVSANPGKGGVLIGEADTYVRADRVVRVDSGYLIGNDPEEQGLDAGNLHVRTCGYTATCKPGRFSVTLVNVSYSAESSQGDVNALYFVVRGAHIQINFRGKGWVLRNEPLAFRHVTPRRSAKAWANFAGRGAAVSQGAQAAGGQSGSIAVAMPPCSASDVGVVARGIGQMTLSGGVTTAQFVCPAVAYPALTSYARTATTWRLTGWAAGDSTLSDQPLLVIDQPTRTTGAAK